MKTAILTRKPPEIAREALAPEQQGADVVVTCSAGGFSQAAAATTGNP